MTTDRHPIWKLLDQIQMDNRAAAAKIVEIRAQVAALGLGDPAPTTFINGPVTAPTCPSCGCGGGHHTTTCVPGKGETARADAQYGAELARAQTPSKEAA